MSIGTRSGDQLSRDIAGGPGAIFDDDLLAEVLRQPFGGQPRRDVDDAAGGKPASRCTGRVG